MQLRGLPPITANDRNKRYGWFRLYEDFCNHPKWQVVAQRTGVEQPRVEAVALRLLTAASKERQDGYIGSFDIEACAAAAKIPMSEVASVCRALEDVGWMRDGVIRDWVDRNPRDQTYNDRKRRQRRREVAERALTMGTATPEQIELLDLEIGIKAREALQRIAALSRVTAAPPADQVQPQQVIEPPVTLFVPIKPTRDDAAAKLEAERANERAARTWLLGDRNAQVAEWSMAVRIVSDALGHSKMAAHHTVYGWLNEKLAGDSVFLAKLISQAHQQAVNGEHFRTVIERSIVEFVREQTAGPAFNFGLTAQKGGRG